MKQKGAISSPLVFTVHCISTVAVATLYTTRRQKRIAHGHDLPITIMLLPHNRKKFTPSITFPLKVDFSQWIPKSHHHITTLLFSFYSWMKSCSSYSMTFESHKLSCENQALRFYGFKLPIPEESLFTEKEGVGRKREAIHHLQKPQSGSSCQDQDTHFFFSL